MRDVLQQRAILFAERHPVIAVHVRYVEPVAIPSPDFIENLVPLFGGHPIDDQSGRGNRLAALIALRSRIINGKGRTGSHHYLRTVMRHRIETDVVGDGGFLAILEREDAQLRRSIALAAVVERRPHRIKQVAGFGGETAIVVGSQRHASNPHRDRVEIDDHVRGWLWRGFGFCFGWLWLFRWWPL